MSEYDVKRAKIAFGLACMNTGVATLMAASTVLNVVVGNPLLAVGTTALTGLNIAYGVQNYRNGAKKLDSLKR